jgi:hypothetical protein
MPDWFARLTRRARPAPGALARALAHYPPYVAPHVGPPARWSRAQAEDNLAHLVAHVDERLQVLGALLRETADIDIAPALAGADAGPLLERLHAWANAEWRATHDPALAQFGRWRSSTRAGPEIVFSLLLDVALLLGELVRRRDPRWQWALDLDPANLRDGMDSAMRPVLLRHDADYDKLLDLEAMVIHRWRHPDDVANQLNAWRRIVRESTAG